MTLQVDTEKYRAKTLDVEVLGRIFHVLINDELRERTTDVQLRMAEFAQQIEELTDDKLIAMGRKQATATVMETMATARDFACDYLDEILGEKGIGLEIYHAVGDSLEALSNVMETIGKEIDKLSPSAPTTDEKLAPYTTKPKRRNNRNRK